MQWIEGLRRLWRLIQVWRARVGQRQLLASLSDHQLKDIGLSRGDVLHEASKPFWRG